MWRRTYLLLLLIRVYFALSPSYLHPDENFQGPEVFAGTVPLLQGVAIRGMSDERFCACAIPPSHREDLLFQSLRWKMRPVVRSRRTTSGLTFAFTT